MKGKKKKVKVGGDVFLSISVNDLASRGRTKKKNKKARAIAKGHEDYGGAATKKQEPRS